MAVECSPTDGACAAILLTSSDLTFLAAPGRLFWAVFVTVPNPLASVLLSGSIVHKTRRSNRIRQRIGSIGKARGIAPSVSSDS